ncbi:cytidine deaminase [Blastomonas sp.]|uniref:cytidine deaminase n=1 Tax=Blastomonas sp. TaxID=1909299 RepID=UPI003593AADA
MTADPFAGGYADPATARTLIASSGLSVGAYLRTQIDRAKLLSRPHLSNYQVGAVGLGASGAIYLGANIEFAGRELCHTVHAEQSVVVSAMAHGETALAAIAISAAPCGSCRQFLRELADFGALDLWLERPAPYRLVEFLPDSFGPDDLGVTAGLLRQTPLPLHVAVSPPPVAGSLGAQAVAAACTSYAPYTRAAGGCALELADGSVWSGTYIENAAFNPSLSPAQTALIALTMAGRDWHEIRAAAVAQLAPQAVDHAEAARKMLAAMGSKVEPALFQLAL